MKRAISPLLFVFVSISPFLFTPSMQSQVSGQAPQAVPVPDWFVYRHAFRDVVMFKNRADAAEKQGTDRSNLRRLVAQKGSLNDEQGEVLERIAIQCEKDVATQDAKAKVLIKAYQAQFPNNIINNSLPVPAPPSQLDDLWQQRIEMILAARDQLRNALGDQAFFKFDAALKKSSLYRPSNRINRPNEPVGSSK
jgi:hypothetical protein